MINHKFTNGTKSVVTVAIGSTGPPCDVRDEFLRRTNRYSRRDFDFYARHKIDGVEQEHFLDRSYDALQPEKSAFIPTFDATLHSATRINNARRTLQEKDSINEDPVDVPAPTLDCYTSTVGQMHGWDWLFCTKFWEMLHASSSTLKAEMVQCTTNNRERRECQRGTDRPTKRRALTHSPTFCSVIINPTL
jgi:hypothetical protein